MKDRIAGAPGQYSAVVTGAEFNKMQNGEPFAITLTRDDKPEVEGTPYSKAAVLPDELAKRLCPNLEDPSPADALDALDKNKAPAVESEEYPGCYYRIVDGVTEWINPPMEPGVEYRTTKRHDGKPVYAKLVLKQFSPPGISSKDNVVVEYQILHSITDKEDGWIYKATADIFPNEIFPLPFIDAYGKTYYTFADKYIVLKLYNHEWDVNYWFSFWCEYTKTTD